MQRAQDVHAHTSGMTQADVGTLRAQVEIEIATKVACEAKTATALDAILQKSRILM